MNPMDAVSRDVDYVFFNSMLRFDGMGHDGQLGIITDRMDCLAKAGTEFASKFDTYRQALFELHKSLEQYFSRRGGWTCRGARAAAEKFMKSGFKSAEARSFAMFARSLFLDDREDWSRCVNCVGLSIDTSKQDWTIRSVYCLIDVIFEDRLTGRQFGVSMPFTADADSANKLFDRTDYYRQSYVYPAYTLFVPDGPGRRSIAANIDNRVVADAVRKFVLRQLDQDNENTDIQHLRYFHPFDDPFNEIYTTPVGMRFGNDPAQKETKS